MPRPPIIAHHLLFSSYGFWLPNDPRGTGSTTLREQKFEPLGPLLPGRQKEQPTRETLRAFYQEATPLLNHPPLWFDPAVCAAIARSFEHITKKYKYTAWACAILSNHAHLCIRQHRNDYQLIWNRYAAEARDVASPLARTTPDHPFWADRPYSVYLHTPDDIRRTIAYIEQNPPKEGLPPQHHPWLHPYTGWPHPNLPRSRY